MLQPSDYCPEPGSYFIKEERVDDIPSYSDCENHESVNEFPQDVCEVISPEKNEISRRSRIRLIKSEPVDSESSSESSESSDEGSDNDALVINSDDDNEDTPYVNVIWNKSEIGKYTPVEFNGAIKMDIQLQYKETEWQTLYSFLLFQNRLNVFYVFCRSHFGMK